MSDIPNIERVRHETRRRQLTVHRVTRLTPQITRVVLRGDELTGFTSVGFDDHVKLFFPTHTAPHDPAAMRDFTPRHYDAAANELWIDFFVHEAGPAAGWASQAAVGQTLTVGGPRGSFVISLDGIDSHVLIGDETALPAIGRRLEELRSGTQALAIIVTGEGAADYPLASQADLKVVRVRKDVDQGVAADPIVAALRELQWPPGRCFVWVAAESQVARTLRRYLTGERKVDKRWLKAAGYWQRGAPGVHDSIAD